MLLATVETILVENGSHICKRSLLLFEG
uniref:Uncharacterized protein n=1 Tax=Rhizophora mucronata TaxID=61149 RepID=A0A2P2PIE4_RHIMU